MLEPMPFADKVFYAELAVFGGAFGTGLFMIFESSHTLAAILVTVIGMAGVGVSLVDHFSTEAKARNRFAIVVVLGIGIWGLLFYDIYNRLSGPVSASSSGTATPGDSRDPTSKEVDVIRDLAIKGSFKVAVYCLTTERNSCHYAKEWLRVLKTAGWKTGGLNETDYEEPNNGLIVCARPNISVNERVGKGEFELALRENSIPLSDDCRDADLAKDTNFDFALLVGGPGNSN